MSDVTKRLLNDYPDLEHINLESPHFHKAGRVHDWRNYVPMTLKAIWPFLSIETRSIIWIMATEEANKEEWE